MATTTRWKADAAPTKTALWAMACAGLAYTAPATAQNWRIEPSVSSTLTWTNNGNFGSTGNGVGKQSDTLLEVTPALAVRGEGGRFNINGRVAAATITSANGTQNSQVQPQGELNARLEAIERLFFVEAGYRASQTSANPFGARAAADSIVGANTLSTSELRLAPYIRGNIGPDTRYLLRSDNSWTREIGSETSSANSAGRYSRNVASIERDPKPMGWRLEARREDTSYTNSAQPSVLLEEAKATLRYAANEELTLGVRAGYERNNLEGLTQQGSFWGGEATWRPTQRTTLDGFYEDRIYGPSWRLGFNHRMPQFAINVALSRGIETTPQALANLPAGQNVTALLDAMLTTRYPDPIERARAVQQLIAQRNLPTSTLRPVNLTDERASLVTQGQLGLTWSGVRNTVAVAVFRVETQDVSNSPLATDSALGNNDQRGASVTWSHRLSANTGLSFSGDWSRIRELGSATPDTTTQRGVSLQFDAQVGPRSTAVAGLRYRTMQSNVVDTSKETAVFVGLNHRF